MITEVNVKGFYVYWYLGCFLIQNKGEYDKEEVWVVMVFNNKMEIVV